MADNIPFSNLINATRGFGQLPMVRQLGLLVGLSASIALGFAVVVWSREPSYVPLFTHLRPEETTQILDSLQDGGIKYKLDQTTGSVLVAADETYKAKIQLASSGLPNATEAGFASMLKEQRIGSSRFMENARYLYAMEEELGRTIASINGVKSARVHLAIPKESAFVGDEKKPSASVLVDLSSGQPLSASQVQAIVHMVASSVANLDSSQVTVVDQQGQLLTSDSSQSGLAQSKEEFNYTKELEQAYEKRINAMLIPLLGSGNVQAKVAALLDFTKIEQTQEQYTPDKTIRSEQVMEQGEKSGQPEEIAKGVPGAASNQPALQSAAQPPQPAAANNPIPAAAAAAANAAGQPAAAGAAPYRMQTTRNYELGRTISHSTMPTGRLQRVSVAVVVNDHQIPDLKTGKVTAKPLTPEEIQKITDLVKNAVGFDQQRGDQVSVVNIPFAQETKIEAANALPIWEESWFWQGFKIALSSALVLLLIFVVLRPVLKSLATKGINTPSLSYMPQVPASAEAGSANGAYRAPLTHEAAPQGWNAVQQLAMDDPKKIAQVMKNWVGNEE
jgi:flagellar M-ring protein FliF